MKQASNYGEITAGKCHVGILSLSPRFSETAKEEKQRHFETISPHCHFK